MPFTIAQMTRMADIVNEAISASEFPTFTVTHNDFDPNDTFMGGGLIKWRDSNNNPVTKAFNLTALNRITDKGQFFHFKSLNIAQLIISNKSVQVSNLLSNQANDFAEYSEFYKRLGLFHQLIPKDYCQQKQTNTFNPASKSPMDEERENILILCFAKEGHKERFWKDYANNDNGVCLVFRLLNFDPQYAMLYNFRDVSYDNGYRFDFINHINYHFIKEFGRQLFVEGITKFSKFYKRGKYEWENEARLAFHYNFDFGGYGNDLQRVFPLQTDPATQRKFINLPLQGNVTPNPYFTLTIDEVICGKNVSPTDFTAIETALTTNFPTATIWQRK
jgi:hypothetical protein